MQLKDNIFELLISHKVRIVELFVRINFLTLLETHMAECDPVITIGLSLVRLDESS
jgi:hypothetical protein